MRAAAARPIEPPRKPNSLTMTAAGCPCTSARPVSTASSVPDFALARFSSSR
jgi:hypothetical protein